MADHDAIGLTIDEAISSYDRRGAVEAALAAVDECSISIEDLYELISAMLVDIGIGWQRGTTEIWEEHFVSGVARTIVEACALRVERAAPATRSATAVLAAPSDEYHDFGLRMLTDRFILAGWRAHFLGANLPLPELVAAVGSLEAHAVVLSASTHYHRTRVRDYVDQISSSHPEVQIWVGGAAFAHDREDWPEAMILDLDAIPEPGGP